MLKIAPIYLSQSAQIQMQRSHALLLVNKAEGTLKIDGHQMDLVPGRIFLLKQQQDAHIEGCMLIGHIIEFQQPLLDNFFIWHTKEMDRGLFVLAGHLPFADHKETEMPFLMDLMCQLTDEVEKQSPVDVFKPYLFLFLFHANRGVNGSESISTWKDRQMEALNILIENNYKSQPKTLFYAQKIGLSSGKLNDFCVEMKDKRCYELVTERRIIEAEFLLRGSMEIKDIAYELGFGNHGHLNLHFKKSKGITPALYRKDLFKILKN